MAGAGNEDGGGRRDVGENEGFDATASGERGSVESSNMLSSKLASPRAGCVCGFRIVDGWGLDWVTVRDGLGDRMSPSLEF